MPKFLYINPTGSNPTGTVLTLERKKDIYKTCSEFDLLIFEDDPYCFITFDEEPLPSFYSMDVDGRVIRFDSFSKSVAPGLRLAFATGPRPLMEKLNFHMQATGKNKASVNFQRKYQFKILF
jgi:kynurenine/2-aminoadipate aminotransferase